MADRELKMARKYIETLEKQTKDAKSNFAEEVSDVHRTNKATHGYIHNHNNDDWQHVEYS